MTVFGFPPSAATYILKQFSLCGTVLQHHVPVNGNWMHIRFQTRTQAQSALSRSGKILGGTLMIGVTLCPESEAMAEAAAGDGLQDSRNNLSLSTSLNTSRSVRPLAQAYKSAQNEHEVSLDKDISSQILHYPLFRCR